MAAPMKKTPVYLASINLAVHFIKRCSEEKLWI